ncbi:3-phosphoshikimate 1-carboxyvinyltransferase [Poritiphilus flavus]|uniref:3-phosphoshikimate 1-carboxyvinyltransferase n=1 Tax=Poritiphilus flavus TaxID=2697053 RepID=A0A6L9EH58_9FLAO|nr:3-phosphoshikimate 1-carboxyvinyltransferase [Poritiphilus flavus]NAS13993.1 3-phosphoshikimate 1-carboxyvinyltransferase [Poritiphilus flavus]
MNLYLSGPAEKVLKSDIEITGSKSESNRLLLLQALYPDLSIDNCSNSDDARVMKKGLGISSGEVDIHHAGTAMRFLTAYFASQQGKEVVLTGSKRMQERPIEVLVEALKDLGADISYLKTSGCPPIKIKGKRLYGGKVSLPANISSQYISALLLVAPRLERGLELELIGTITSIPYIKMTLGLLEQIGVGHSFEGNIIKVAPLDTVSPRTLVVESDWSSASYFYSILALSEAGSTIRLSAYREHSLQGDSILADLYKALGVDTQFQENSIVLTKTSRPLPSKIDLDLSNAPDLAQTLVVTCFGLGLPCHLSGLHTLKIKETDRLEALKNELGKLGADISVTDKSLRLEAATSINKAVSIATYNDHRMAMAFAPLALRTDLIIDDAEVVSKSYPDFWKDLDRLAFQIKEV